VTYLPKILSPSSVAVLCGPESTDPIGPRIVRNLVGDGFKGRVFPIPSDGRPMGDFQVYSGLEETSASPDLAVITLPYDNIPSAVEACARAGVAIAVLMNRSLQPREAYADLVAEAKKAGVRLIGPRSWGILNPWNRFNASLAPMIPAPGKLAVIAQSASICANIVDLSFIKKIGLSLMVGLGEMMDVDCSSLIDYLANHFRVGAVLLHFEKPGDMRDLMSAARAAARIKPVVVLKTGRGLRGARYAFTPTGALVDEDSAYSAAFRRAGAVRVETVEDLFDCGDLGEKQPRPRGSNLVVLTNARNPGLMAIDFLARHNIEPAGLGQGTRAALESLLPKSCAEDRFISVREDSSPAVYASIIEACLRAEEIDALLIIMAPQFLSDPRGVAQAVRDTVSKKRIPVLAVWMGGTIDSPEVSPLKESGVPIFESPERAVNAFRYLYAYDYNLKLLQEIPPRLSGRFEINRSKVKQVVDAALSREVKVLNELESLNLLKAYDLPTVTSLQARTVDEALAEAEKVGYPLNLKVLSSQIINKAEAMTAAYDIRRPDELVKAYETLLRNAAAYNPQARLDGVLIQPLIRRSEFELRLGSRWIDPFGPVLIFGQGQVRSEVSTDYSLGLPPLNRILARRIIERTRIYKLLSSHGDGALKRLVHLEELLVNVSQLVTHFPEIRELEIDPLVIGQNHLWVTDAQVVLHDPGLTSPMHLVISPYPDEYESQAVTKSGMSIFIRPIKPEDAALLQELWSTLSPRTLYYRFTRHKMELTPDLLTSFTQIDYDREIALVALDRPGGKERMLAVARLIGAPETNLAEFAVVVGDPWQGLGVGAQLMIRLIAIAAKRRNKLFWGLVLSENRAMLELARRVGCSVLTEDDPSQVEVSLNLTCDLTPEVLEIMEELNQGKT